MTLFPFFAKPLANSAPCFLVFGAHLLLLLTLHTPSSVASPTLGTLLDPTSTWEGQEKLSERNGLGETESDALRLDNKPGLQS